MALSASCLRVEQTLTLKPDGSGTFALRYGMSLEDIEEMKRMAQQAAEAEGLDAAVATQSPFDFDEEQVRADFEEYKSSGVALEKVRSEVIDGWKYLDLEIRFESLKGFAETEFVSDRGFTLIRQEDGNYEFRQAAPPSDDSLAAEGVGDMMAEIMKGFHATVRVVAPARVLESNADARDDRTATWEFDLARDPKALDRARRMDLRMVFEGQGLELPELKGVTAE